jgi:hypothetical protein
VVVMRGKGVEIVGGPEGNDLLRAGQPETARCLLSACCQF